MEQVRPITDLTVEERGEVQRVESELDSFVEKRSAKDGVEKGDAARDAAWAESVHTYHAKRQADTAQAWYDYHHGMVTSHEASLGVLINYHRKERARYARVLGLPELKGSEN